MEQKEIINNIKEALNRDVNKNAEVSTHKVNGYTRYTILNNRMDLSINEFSLSLYDFEIELYSNSIVITAIRNYNTIQINYENIYNWEMF